LFACGALLVPVVVFTNVLSRSVFGSRVGLRVYLRRPSLM
jgi:hypothetical protein